MRCNYPLQSKPQGFFSKSAQTGYSRADAYSAARRGQPQQVPYPAQQPVQQPPPPQNGNQIQVMRDANGNQVYVQLMYDRITGKPVYVQMIPQIVGHDASGKPVYGMVPVSQSQQMYSQQMYSQQMQSQQMQSQQMQSQQMQSQQMQSQQMQSQQMQSQQMQFRQMPPQPQPKPVSVPNPSNNNAFASKNTAAPPPVPVMPRPGEQPEQPASSIPDRPAIRASNIASSMYAQSQNTAGTGSFFARVQQQKQQQYSGYDAPVSAQDLLKEEARTAFAQPAPEPVNENDVLKRIFESKSREYQMNTGYGNSTFAVDVNPNEVASVSEKNVYKPPQKTAPKLPRYAPEPEPEPEPPKPEPKPEKPEPRRLFGGKKAKEKEKPKHKTIIVDPDEIFGDSKKHKVEMLGISIDGDDKAVDKKMQEMKNGGKKSTRSMIAADVSLESMVDDPLSGDAARRALTDEAIQQAYDSVESAEIAKALEQLNQGIFPKSFK